MRTVKILTLLLLVMLVPVMAFGQDTPTVKVSLQPANFATGQTATIKAAFELPAGHHVVKQEEYLYIDIDETPGLQFKPTQYPKGVLEHGTENYHGSFELTRPFTAQQPGQYTITAYVSWQMCDDAGTCFPPEEHEQAFSFTVSGDPIASTAGTNKDLPLTDLPPKQEVKSFSSLLRYLIDGGDNSRPIGVLFKFLLMAFAGGIILNIMPCVLPVLSIKAMHIVGQSQSDKREIMISSLAYTLGILASFFIMAVVVSAIKIAGEGVGWGFQFQSVGFSLTLAAIIFVFALSLFDVFIINAPGMQTAYKAGAKKGHMGSFLSGVFAVLLATPCTAPLLGPALGVAFSLPPLLILVFFLAIGLGLALPFILLAFWPAIIKKIPKPGNWMNTFKEFMGFLLMGTTIFILRTVYILVGGGSNFLSVLWFFLILALAAWVYGTFAKPQFSKARQWLVLLLAIAMVVAGGWLLLDFDPVDGTQSGNYNKQGWETFNPSQVHSLIEQGVPVFVDFGAEWCMTCKTNETTVLYTKTLEDAFAAKGVRTFRGDNTKRDPVITEWLKRYNRAGVPLYLLFRPGESEAVVFPEIITQSMVLEELEKIK